MQLILAKGKWCKVQGARYKAQGTRVKEQGIRKQEIGKRKKYFFEIRVLMGTLCPGFLFNPLRDESWGQTCTVD